MENSNYDVTILTEGLFAPKGLYRKMRRAAKNILAATGLYRLKPVPEYGGHRAVTRSLIEGLRKIGYEHFNYRPQNESQIKENVHVLSGVSTLRYAIELKKQGKIKRLTAGPNIVVFSDDEDSIICDENVDLFCQPSDWARDYHIQISPSLSGRCVSWPAGVDTEFFKPEKKYTQKYEGGGGHVLIYHKDESNQFCYRLDYLLRKHGFTTHTIKYRYYNLSEYKALLNRSSFMVALGCSESEGLYLVEAWSMDVPTICFEPYYYRWKYDYIERELAGNISTAPYMTDKTGCRFTELREFEAILADWDNISSGLAPREWVLENMSDEVCARKFIEAVRG